MVYNVDKNWENKYQTITKEQQEKAELNKDEAFNVACLIMGKVGQYIANSYGIQKKVLIT